MLLKILLQSILLLDNPRVIIIIDVVTISLQVLIRSTLRDGDSLLILTILHVIQLFIGEVIKGKIR